MPTNIFFAHTLCMRVHETQYLGQATPSRAERVQHAVFCSVQHAVFCRSSAPMLPAGIRLLTLRFPSGRSFGSEYTQLTTDTSPSQIQRMPRAIYGSETLARSPSSRPHAAQSPSSGGATVSPGVRFAHVDSHIQIGTFHN